VTTNHYFRKHNNVLLKVRAINVEIMSPFLTLLNQKITICNGGKRKTIQCSNV